MVGLERCTDKLSETRNLSRSSAASLEPVRTLWQQPCYYVTCPSAQIPRHNAFETRCRVCSMWRQLCKPRAQLLDVEGEPQRNASSQPEKTGRYRFTKCRRLEAKERCPFRTASSIIEDNTTLDMTSTSITIADAGTQKSVATALTTAGSTIVTRIRWPRSHRVVESLAGKSAAHRYRARFDPRPASPNTTVKPSQNCGLQISGWHARWEALEEMIEPSSGSYRSFSPTPLVGGSRSSLPNKSTTGPTWSRCLKGTSRGLTYTPAIRGTSVSASRNLENLSDSMLDASPSSAPSSRTSPTMTSFWLSSRAPPVKIWYES